MKLSLSTNLILRGVVAIEAEKHQVEMLLSRNQEENKRNRRQVRISKAAKMLITRNRTETIAMSARTEESSYVVITALVLST